MKFISTLVTDINLAEVNELKNPYNTENNVAWIEWTKMGQWWNDNGKQNRSIILGVKPGLASNPGLHGERPRLTTCAMAPSHVNLEFSKTLHLS